jgi:hypothetical protein
MKERLQDSINVACVPNILQACELGRYLLFQERMCRLEMHFKGMTPITVYEIGVFGDHDIILPMLIQQVNHKLVLEDPLDDADLPLVIL